MQRLSERDNLARMRGFLESGEVGDRRVTAEWLAGRLGIPIQQCQSSLERLARDGLIERRERVDDTTWFDIVTPNPSANARRFGLGFCVVLASLTLAVGGAMLHHIFFFALGVGLGLILAFAWLDWELRSRM
jgi:hypothetical protein